MLIAVLALTGGCTKKKKPEPVEAKPGASSAAPATPKPPVAKAKPLDVDKLRKELKCKKGGGIAGPCAVLDAFKDCTALPALTDAGESRYLGQGYVVKDRAFVETFTVLKRSRVPTANLRPGQLASTFAIGAIPDDRSGALRHAKKAVSKFERGDVTKSMNAAVRYVKERTDWQDKIASLTDGQQVHIASDAIAYACALKDQRLLIVQESSTSNKVSDGLYATLWPVSW